MAQLCCNRREQKLHHINQTRLEELFQELKSQSPATLLASVCNELSLNHVGYKWAHNMMSQLLDIETETQTPAEWEKFCRALKLSTNQENSKHIASVAQCVLSCVFGHLSKKSDDAFNPFTILAVSKIVLNVNIPNCLVSFIADSGCCHPSSWNSDIKNPIGKLKLYYAIAWSCVVLASAREIDYEFKSKESEGKRECCDVQALVKTISATLDKNKVMHISETLRREAVRVAGSAAVSRADAAITRCGIRIEDMQGRIPLLGMRIGTFQPLERIAISSCVETHYGYIFKD